MKDILADTVAVIGLGLIGGSVALSLRERQLVHRVVGYDLSPETREEAVRRGVVHAAVASVAEAVDDAQIIVLAVPVLSVEGVLSAVRDHLWRNGHPVRNDLAITDVGSVKKEILSAAERVFSEVPSCLVPAHPIAGSEQHGVAAARTGLFDDHKVIVTPHPEISESALGLITRFWQALGGEVVPMDAVHHDQVLAGTSHLPHLLAYALVDTLASTGDRFEIFKYAAGGFRDFTRIAASDPTMWRDIFTSNGTAVLEILDTYIDDLQRLRSAIARGDDDTLIDTFRRAKIARDYFSSLHSGN